MALPQNVTSEQLLEAMRRFDSEFRSHPDLAGWEDNLAHKYAIENDGKRYPVKRIISIATGASTSSFSGGADSNGYVRQRGLNVVELHANALHDSLEAILDNYVASRVSEPFSSQTQMAKAFERCRQLLSSGELLDEFPTIKVRSSYGQGNWAKVPWIAFLDSRETDTTQKGVYPVILFRQDCSGLYVTFNQGVTEPQRRVGTIAGLEELREKAKLIRSQTAGKSLAAAGFLVDNPIDLKADAGLGRDYEASTIAHKLYPRGEVPGDATILRDVQAVLRAYAEYLAPPTAAASTPAVHLLLKWSAARTPDTTERHQRIAGDKGAVWWGKFGNVGISEERFARIRQQLDDGQLTKVFLKAGDSLWETKLNNITHNKEHVDVERLPSYYGVDDCKLFVLISDFRPVTTEWFMSHVVSDSDPVPGSAEKALSSQANPAYLRIVSEPVVGPALCLIGTVKDSDAWLRRAQDMIDREGAWASWWSFPVRPEAQSQLTTPFELYINTGGGSFPLRLIVSDYETGQGPNELASPWPDVTDPADVGKSRAGDTKPQIFKTWFKVASIQTIAPPWRLENFQPAPGLSTQTSLLNPSAFGYAHVAKLEGVTMESLVEQTHLDRSLLEEIVAALCGRQRQIVLAGPPGTSKTFIAQCIARYICQGVPDAYRLVQFHPSYSYESFIEGVKPVVRPEGGISFEREDGVVLELVAQMKARGHVGSNAPPHLLLIDEMNRANLPRVFGELMYLFEYRDQPMRLQYSGNFTLPPNLGFIGTMNTADRSIRSIDSALRRRFDVFEFPPSGAVLERFFSREPLHIHNLVAGFEALNTELENALDRHHTIGHAFFMKSGLDRGALRAIWRRKIYPLVEEYFFDQPDLARSFTVERFWPEVGA